MVDICTDTWKQVFIFTILSENVFFSMLFFYTKAVERILLMAEKTKFFCRCSVYSASSHSHCSYIAHCICYRSLEKVYLSLPIRLSRVVCILKIVYYAKISGICQWDLNLPVG